MDAAYGAEVPDRMKTLTREIEIKNTAICRRGTSNDEIPMSLETTRIHDYDQLDGRVGDLR